MVGRDIVELCVLTVTKGDALTALRETVGAAHVLFAGDDMTDEHAIATLRPGDVGIRIGDGASRRPRTGSRGRTSWPTRCTASPTCSRPET